MTIQIYSTLAPHSKYLIRQQGLAGQNCDAANSCSIIILSDSSMDPISDLQTQNAHILFLVQQVGLPKLFPYFSNTDVLSRIRQRGLNEFLLNIPSYELRKALKEREQMEDERARNKPARMKYNVLDFTIQQLVKHCWDNRLISLDDRHSKQYTIRDHHQLGMSLVITHPHKYEVGARSHHFNCARKIQVMYGILTHSATLNEEEDEESYVQHPQDQQEQLSQSYDYSSEAEASSESALINDQQEQSNYSISDQQVSWRHKKKVLGKKVRLIKKRDRKEREKGRKVKSRQSSSSSALQDEQIKREQIYYQESESPMIKQRRGEKQSKKKLTIDSDESC